MPSDTEKLSPRAIVCRTCCGGFRCSRHRRPLIPSGLELRARLSRLKLWKYAFTHVAIKKAFVALRTIIRVKTPRRFSWAMLTSVELTWGIVILKGKMMGKRVLGLFHSIYSRARAGTYVATDNRSKVAVISTCSFQGCSYESFPRRHLGSSRGLSFFLAKLTISHSGVSLG